MEGREDIVRTGGELKLGGEVELWRKESCAVRIRRRLIADAVLVICVNGRRERKDIGFLSEIKSLQFRNNQFEVRRDSCGHSLLTIEALCFSPQWQ